MTKILDSINSPSDLKRIQQSDLPELATEIRNELVSTVDSIGGGGHLASNLGVVELTLALYQTLDLDNDKVVWDVGHQAYPHKLITGRFERFDTLRQQGGVAGYLKRSESSFDHFGA